MVEMRAVALPLGEAVTRTQRWRLTVTLGKEYALGIKAARVVMSGVLPLPAVDGRAAGSGTRVASGGGALAACGQE